MWGTIMKIITNFRIFGKDFDFAFRIAPEKIQRIDGITNITEDGKWIIFMDFDGFKIEWLDFIVPHIQKLYGLSDAYVFQSSNDGFHVITFDKLTINKLVDVLKSSSTDPNYVFVPLRYGKRVWSLRASAKNGEKPKYLKSYKHKGRHIRSLAHMIIFEKIYGIKVDKSNNDGLKNHIVICDYYVT